MVGPESRICLPSFLAIQADQPQVAKKATIARHPPTRRLENPESSLALTDGVARNAATAAAPFVDSIRNVKALSFRLWPSSEDPKTALKFGFRRPNPHAKRMPQGINGSMFARPTYDNRSKPAPSQTAVL